MADENLVYTQFRYKVEMTYIDTVNGENTEIITECIKFLVIDHNYDDHCMPILYANLSLDRKLLDDMILNINDNLMLIAVYKYDDLTETKQEIEVFRDKFTYFLPDDVNKNDPIDYNETTMEENLGNTFRQITLGLLSINMINRNKQMLELNVTNNTIFDCAKYCLQDMPNIIIEPFSFSDTLDRVIMPVKESVNKALKYLNSVRVFYYTPYRFYQDFSFTYLISSSGRATAKDNELYTSVLVDIKDIDDSDAYSVGTAIDKDNELYHVYINYANSSVYDNTIANKSKNKIRGVTSTGVSTKDLNNNASYSTSKTSNIRLYNDNTNMIYNLESEENASNIYLFFTKADLDMDVFTINKRFTVHNIDRYQDNNGEYLLTHKRECLTREDDSYLLTTMINMRKIENSSDATISTGY
jgi:hypothetical protein